MKVRIKGIHRIEQAVEIKVSFNELAEHVEFEIKRRHNIASDGRLDSQGRIVCDERGHRHGSIGTDTLDEKPSVEQVNALQFIKQLNDYVRQFNSEDSEKSITGM